MIRLNLAAEPRWYDFLDGVRFKLRPASSTIMAEARGAERLEQMVQDNASNQALSIGLAKEVARLALDEWEGICDEAGQPMDPTPEAIDAAMEVWPLFEAFQVQYMAPALMKESEKNDSAPSHNGTSAGASRIAKAAAKPAKNARIGSTGRKR
jgi:hypothetical protein